MNKETINQLLQNPDSVTKNDLEDIELLLKKFPYFNGAVHLSAKVHILSASLDQGKKTSQSALFAGNRLTIKNLLQTHPAEKIVSEEIKIPIAKAEIGFEEKIEIPDQELNSAEEKLELHFNNHLLESELELAKKETEDEIENIENITLRYYVHLPEFGKDLRISREDLISEYMRFRKVDEIIPPDISEQANIIQKFIEVNPSISRFDNVLPTESGKIDLSQKSTAEDEELVSETLANILLKQEKFKKAIEIFEKLMLKYPDKSAYFAAQIQQTRLKLK